MEKIGTKILEIRKRKGLTQEELSDLSKINLRTLQRIEKGETNPHSNTLKNICQVLEINIVDILDYGKTEDNRFIILFHLSVLSFIIIPLGNIILPLILWILKRDKIVHLNKQGVHLLTFQIIWSLFFYLSFLGSFITKIFHIGYGGYLLGFSGLLFLVNIIYPIVISVLISKNGVRDY
jgi:transcriptional regulator with XRE-family HTH domain